MEVQDYAHMLLDAEGNWNKEDEGAGGVVGCREDMDPAHVEFQEGCILLRDVTSLASTVIRTAVL
jgi:hypothetical protein